MPEPGAPTVLGLFGDEASRRAVWRYWVRDTFRGLLNLLLYNALRLLPTGLCSRFGAANAVFCPRRFPASDARARRLWIKLRPENSAPAEVDAAMRRLWRNVARTMAEYSVIDRLWSEGRVTVEGAQHVQDARAAGKPIVLIGLHISNWEVIGVAATALGIPYVSTYEPPANRFDHFIAKQVRRRFGARVVRPDVTAAIAGYYALVRDKAIFIFYVDALINGRVSAPAFGRGFSTNNNIAKAVRLARLANAELIVLYTVRLGDEARFKIVCLPPVPQLRTDDSDADLRANIETIEGVVAPIVRAHLDQWYYALDFEFTPPPE
jgi:KDO2-lipid IV(A) lauroyltransferase